MADSETEKDWEQDDKGQWSPTSLKGSLQLLAGFALIWVLMAVLFIWGATQ